MKTSKIALTALFGIAVIFTIYGVSEGYSKYHEIQVKTKALINISVNLNFNAQKKLNNNLFI